MMGHKDEGCSCGGFSALLMGGLIGAGLALLLAPQAGKKTRACLADYAKDLGDKANDAASDFAETLSEFIDNVGDRATEILHEKADLTMDSKKALLRALEKGQAILEKQRKKLEDMID